MCIQGAQGRVIQAARDNIFQVVVADWASDVLHTQLLDLHTFCCNKGTLI